jgi:hypothetical protein
MSNGSTDKFGVIRAADTATTVSRDKTSIATSVMSMGRRNSTLGLLEIIVRPTLLPFQRLFTVSKFPKPQLQLRMAYLLTKYKTLGPKPTSTKSQRTCHLNMQLPFNALVLPYTAPSYRIPNPETESALSVLVDWDT